MRSYTWPPVEARKILAGTKTQFRPLAVLPALVAGGKGLSVVGDGRPVAGVAGRQEAICTDPDHGADWRTSRQYDKVRPFRQKNRPGALYPVITPQGTAPDRPAGATSPPSAGAP